VRVSSLDPADVDDEFLETVANTSKVCPHIHLALQAGSAATLRAMRRRYTPEMFARAARRWREIRPDGGLTTDIIVGFPGESAEDFEKSLEMARMARFSAIHVFPYSPREGTVAANLPGKLRPPSKSGASMHCWL
jgi:threonylcarbamoyladenosine tRNA methylthiotransferase MtaB